MNSNVQKRESAITEMQHFEIELVTCGTAAAAIAGRVFGALGVVQTIVWAGEQAYEAGRWLGSQ
jgi:hypothetical protein